MMLFLPSIAAFVAVTVLIPLVSRWAHAVGFVDEPGGRKQHDEPIPLIGGLVIFPVFMVAGTVSGYLPQFWPLYLGLVILLVTGAVDDRHPLRPAVKLGIQALAAAIIVIAGGVELHHLGNLFGFGDFSLGFLSIPFSIVAVTLLINAINLMDGLDGLAAGKTFGILIWLVLASFIAGDVMPVAMMGPLLAGIAGFLVYNMRHPMREKASVFLGDAGSMGLGLCIAWFGIALAQDPDPVLTPISVAWVLALPIMDECAQFYRRVREGRHPFAPDRKHFHHHFIRAQFSVARATTMVLTIGFVLGGIGYVGVLVGVPEVILTLGWIFLLFSHMFLSQNPDHYVGWLKRLKR